MGTSKQKRPMAKKSTHRHVLGLDLHLSDYQAKEMHDSELTKPPIPRIQRKPF